MDGDGRRVVPPTKMRQAISRAMSHSKQAAPHFYVTTEIDMDAALAALSTLNEGRSSDDRASVTALLIKAVALTLVDEPRFNAHLTDEGHVLIDEVNVGVAIALDEGLIAPALLDCADLGLVEIANRLRDLAHRSREGKLRGPEMMGATFTVSNLGMFDVSSFVAIVNPPQVAILATGSTVPKAVVDEGEVTIRSVMTATLSADHRAVDGADSARFLTVLKRRLESPNWVESDE